MISLRYRFSLVAGVLVATVLLTFLVALVTVMAGDDEYDFAVGEGSLGGVSSRIQFHTQFKDRNPGGFFDELSLSQLPDVVYFRSEFGGLKSGHRYLQKLHVYDPEGNIVKSGNHEFAPNNFLETAWNTWNCWDGEDIFTGPGIYRVESILVDKNDNQYVVFSRDLTVGK